uniref:C2h2-type zn-finger protein n=1 Tax=Culex tarsalis TaxID=7177 RepID=A0A1Q3EYH8_CULTA
MQDNLKQLCRVCMRSNPPETYNIYAPLADPSQPNLHRMLSSVCAPVFSCSEDSSNQNSKEWLGLPKIVCASCRQSILDAYKLHTKCIETDRRLWEMIRVKQEVHIEQDEDQVFPECSDDPLLEEEANSPKQELEDDESDEAWMEPVDDLNDDSSNSRKSAGKKPRAYCPKKHRCDRCTDVYTSIRELKQHIINQHPEKAHKCSMCDKALFNEQLLSSHMLGHTTGKGRECDVCHERFKSYSGLKAHKIKHTGSLFMCSICDKSFTSKHTLEVHIQRHIGEKQFSCSQCPMRFVTRAEVRVHASTHNKTQNHVCEICGSRFTRNVSLVKHVKVVHAGERRHPCQLCPLKFPTADHLKRHMRTHTGEKPFKCAYCDRAYAQSGDLVKHSKIHVGENPYACDRCDAAFRLMTELRNHYTVHYQQSDEQSSSKDKPLVFTSQAMLERRFEQEKLLGESGQSGKGK